MQTAVCNNFYMATNQEQTERHPTTANVLADLAGLVVGIAWFGAFIYTLGGLLGN